MFRLRRGEHIYRSQIYCSFYLGCRSLRGTTSAVTALPIHFAQPEFAFTLKGLTDSVISLANIVTSQKVLSTWKVFSDHTKLTFRKWTQSPRVLGFIILHKDKRRSNRKTGRGYCLSIHTRKTLVLTKHPTSCLHKLRQLNIPEKAPAGLYEICCIAGHRHFELDITCKINICINPGNGKLINRRKSSNMQLGIGEIRPFRKTLRRAFLIFHLY